MEVIVITPELNQKNEYQLLEEMAALGLKTIHLRKPKMGEIELRAWLEDLPAVCLNKIVLHSHWHLAREFSVKGVHGKPKYLEAFQNFQGLSLSFSAHKLSEIENAPEWVDYMFFSPVFPSISKEGYHPELEINELMLSLSEIKKPYHNIVALGGIDVNNVEKIMEGPFDGVALLGGIWSQKTQLAVENFQQISGSLCQLPA